MTKIAAYLILFALLSTHCFAQATDGVPDTTLATRENTQSRKAISIATDFINDLFKGASSMDLASQCTVPFCHENTLILNRNDLKAYFDRAVSQFSQILQKDRPQLDSAYVFGVQMSASPKTGPQSTRVFQIFYPLNGALQFLKDFRSPFVDKAFVLYPDVGNTVQHI